MPITSSSGYEIRKGEYVTFDKSEVDDLRPGVDPSNRGQ